MNGVQFATLVRLTQDPELKKNNNGTSILNCSVAWNTYEGKDENDNAKDLAHFISVEAFGSVADRIFKFYHKGDLIFAEVQLRHNRWETQDGDKKSRHILRILDFSFTKSKNNGDSNNYQQNNQVEEDKSDIPMGAGSVKPTEEVFGDMTDDDIPF